MIKRFGRYLYIKLSRFFVNKYYPLYWLCKNGAIVRRPLHINCGKYISIGKQTSIDEYCRLDCYPISENSDPMITIGKRCLIGFNCTFLSAGHIIIGDDCLFASNVFITTENHGMNPENGKYLLQPLNSKDVIIENNCWIGEKVSIMPGVKIGKWSVVGTGAVVTKNIPEYSMAVGNPAKVIRKYDFVQKKWDKIVEREE